MTARRRAAALQLLFQTRTSRQVLHLLPTQCRRAQLSESLPHLCRKSLASWRCHFETARRYSAIRSAGQVQPLKSVSRSTASTRTALHGASTGTGSTGGSVAIAPRFGATRGLIRHHRLTHQLLELLLGLLLLLNLLQRFELRRREHGLCLRNGSRSDRCATPDSGAIDRVAHNGAAPQVPSHSSSFRPCRG